MAIRTNLALPAAPAKLLGLPPELAIFLVRNCYHLTGPLIIVEAMATKKLNRTIATAIEIERAIHVFRGQRVVLDSDLAVLYGVATRVLNQQVSRNRDRFPDDFAFQLTQQEFTSLMSQIVTSKPGRGGRRKRPFAFTEQGVAMLSSVLKSPTAVQVNIEIMRAFVRLRRLLATPGELVEQLTKLAETVQLHDDQIKVISRVLQQMIEKPAAPRRSIGFHADRND
jgi:ORF6N domain